MRYVRAFIAQSSISSPQNLVHDAGGPEEGEAMEAVNDDDEAMMAMMGMTGFGSTKVLVSASLPCFPQSFALSGSARPRKPRRCGQCQESANMETVHEQVCSLKCTCPVRNRALCLDVGDSIGLWIKSSRLLQILPSLLLLSLSSQQ
jgi:hypothetical protein